MTTELVTETEVVETVTEETPKVEAVQTPVNDRAGKTDRRRSRKRAQLSNDTCYDPTLEYVVVSKGRGPGSRGTISFSNRKILAAAANEGRESVARLTLPVVLSTRRGRKGNPDTTLTAVWEARDAKAQTPWSVMVGAPHGLRSNITHVVHLVRDQDTYDVLHTTGRRALVEVQIGSLIVLSSRPRWNEIQILVYRVDNIMPWPGECPLQRDGKDSYGVANVSLIASRRQDRFETSDSWTDVDLLNAAQDTSTRQGRSANMILDGIEDMAHTASENLLYPDQTPPYVEFFSTALNTQSAQFVIPEDGLLNRSEVTAEGFMSSVFQLFSEYRVAIAGDATIERMPRSLPCSVHFDISEDRGSVKVTLEVPSITDEFKSFEITTTLDEEDLPDTLVNESKIVWRAETLTDLINAIDEHGPVKYLYTVA